MNRDARLRLSQYQISWLSQGRSPSHNEFACLLAEVFNNTETLLNRSPHRNESNLLPEDWHSLGKHIHVAILVLMDLLAYQQKVKNYTMNGSRSPCLNGSTLIHTWKLD